MQSVTNILRQYDISFPDEKNPLSHFRTFLDGTPKREGLVSRKNFIGHVTASGILIWRSQSKVLLMKHVGLDAFYQPGGHFEKPDETPLEVARRHLTAALGS